MAKTELTPAVGDAAKLIPRSNRDSLVAWFNLYMGIEAGEDADETVAAKTRDLKKFLGYFEQAAGTDQVDLWTRSITQGFLKYLERECSGADLRIVFSACGSHEKTARPRGG